MPANLTPDYLKAEQWFKTATTNEEKILALEKMLQVIPKHKGTEKMQAELKKKLSHFREASTQKKAGTHTDIFHVPRGGAGQVVLLGTPNSGKSSIVAALTNAKVNVANFPYATNAPVPGIVEYEDIQIQLIDMPPITADFVAPGQVGTYRNCDIIAIVIDLSSDVNEQMNICLDFLESKSLLIDNETPSQDGQGNAMGKKAFCICTKSDIAKEGSFENLKKSCKYPFGFIRISAEEFEGLEELTLKMFEMLEIIRVYAKPPGKPADMKEPFTLPIGSTVMDLATHIHRHMAENLKSARIWGTGVHDGQSVHLNHILHDKDIVELHFS